MEELEERARQEICSESEPLYYPPESLVCKEGSRLVFGKGPSDAQIVFVGSHPGKSENESGQPFTGKAGENLSKLCKMFAIDLKSIYVTNVLKLALFGHLQQPTNQDIIRHSRWLERQLQFIQPRLVVALGNVASKTLLYLFKHHNLDMTSSQEQDLQIKRINGHVHDIGFSYTVITTFNPIMYSDEAYQKPLEKGFKAINHEIRKTRVSISNVFDIKPVVKMLSATNSSTLSQAKTRQEIETAIKEFSCDLDPEETFDLIYDFFKCILDDTMTFNSETIQQVATSFQLEKGIVQDIAIFQAQTVKEAILQTPGGSLSRKRSASPVEDSPAPKRNKPIN